MPKHKVSLQDRYTQLEGRVHLRGSQAMIRLLFMQRLRDERVKLNTAGFVSGYRGSPMTAIDQELWRAGQLLPHHHIKFWPGTNEHLAMTSVWGTQQTNYYNDSTYDGVFGMWYGKGPGLDQSIDALRQGNWHGSDKYGGVLICVGDDHDMTSTINNYSSELLFQDQFMPVLYPADIQEVLDLGILGYALSRFCGAWVGFKLLPETIETSASVDANINRLSVKLPEFVFPEEGVNAFLTDSVYVQEARIKQYRLPAAVAFARANHINFVSHSASKPYFGIASMGKSWRDTLQALQDLGIDGDAMERLGISILKVGMPYPVDLQTYRDFAQGLDQVLIIEEKRELLATGFREACYHLPAERRPALLGRTDQNEQPLLPNDQPITVDHIAMALARLLPLKVVDGAQRRLTTLKSAGSSAAIIEQIPMQRIPYFCSGCPHNVSTRLPKGSRGQGGVGCHYMVTWMDRETYTFCQMGGEGVTWIGQEPFVTTDHIFQNLGDGTYFHSGSLAIRAAVSAGINITYKLLFNDAVAMTGGQPVDGMLTVDQISRQAILEGVRAVAVISDAPERYKTGFQFAPGTTIHNRRELNSVQSTMRKIKGTTLLIYDQTCAAEKRRRRKRGTYPDPNQRYFINERVCEGCGDCSVQSNCVSIQPLDTPFGRKRRIDQSSCNKDYSCVEGFCPSFVTITGSQLKQASALVNLDKALHEAKLHQPSLPTLKEEDSFNILITGVGGTGIVTIGALLGMAAHIDNLSVSVVDQLGFAQKGGSVVTHVKLAQSQMEIHSARINSAATDTLIACDMLVAGHDKILPKLNPSKTSAIINTEQNFTGDFTLNADLQYPEKTLITRLESVTKQSDTRFLPASKLARNLLGDSLATNLLLTGYAWQAGLIPISREAIHEAIELNGISVDWNKKAFACGRLLAHQPSLQEELLTDSEQVVELIDTHSDDVIKTLTNELEAYQDVDYGRQFHEYMIGIQEQLSSLSSKREHVTSMIAKSLFKLMAYKDEYEVARLHTDPAFLQQLEQQFDGNFSIAFNLAPPLLAPRNKHTGQPRKIKLGSWVLSIFRLLARLKFLRGTLFDPFGYTRERRDERALVQHYKRLIEELVQSLRDDNLDNFMAIVSLPLSIRGYGHIKAAAVTRYHSQLRTLLGEWESSIRDKAA